MSMQLYSSFSHARSGAKHPRFGQEKHWGRSVDPAHIPNTLREFDERLRACHLDFSKAESHGQHDMLAHILGGGLPTPTGEVFGELMERVLSTPQYKSKERLWPNILECGLDEPEDTWIDHEEAGTLVVPRFETFMKAGQTWEKIYCQQKRLQPAEKLSLEQFKELYDYAIELLAMYIQRWGVKPDTSLLGEKTGYKTVAEVSQKALDMNL
jgi:hypothetical protein